MKILLLADLHTSPAITRVNPSNYDLVFIAGDITGSDIEYAKHVLEQFGEKLVFVHGNNESKEIIELFEKHEGYVHGRVIKKKGLKIAGIGGSLPTPFGTRNEYSEKEMEKIASRIGEVDVLIFHNPPFSMFDEVDKENLGSKTLLQLVKEKKPKLVCFGHLHEKIGIAKIENGIAVKIPGFKLFKAGFEIKWGEWKAEMVFF